MKVAMYANELPSTMEWRRQTHGDTCGRHITDERDFYRITESMQ